MQIGEGSANRQHPHRGRRWSEGICNTRCCSEEPLRVVFHPLPPQQFSKALKINFPCAWGSRSKVKLSLESIGVGCPFGGHRTACAWRCPPHGAPCWMSQGKQYFLQFERFPLIFCPPTSFFISPCAVEAFETTRSVQCKQAPSWFVLEENSLDSQNTALFFIEVFCCLSAL